MRTALALALGLVFVASSCVSVADNGRPSSPTHTSSAKAAQIRDLAPAGPQSFTPETKPKPRARAVTQRWAVRVGPNDHRSTVVAAGGSLYVGAPSGVAVLEASTGARRALLPGARGRVVGVALEGDRVYSTSESGELAAATRAGATLFRVQLGAAAATPPTLVDVDGDGAFEVAVGDALGRVSLHDGATGKRRWVRSLDAAPDGLRSIGAGLAAADVDGDGLPEIVAGAESGTLAALRGSTGERAWTVKRSSPLRAAPLIGDVDADKKPEVIVGWADGDVVIVDGKSGNEIWSAHVEEDNGDPTGLLASPTPVPGGRVGALIVPTARWGAEDAVILLGAHDRAHRSRQGRVVTSPVLGTVDPETAAVEAVVGTERGDVVAFDARGGTSLLYHLASGIQAPLMFADIENDGTQELLAWTADGTLTALALHVAVPPVHGRARGSARNDGVLPAIDLGWKLP
jgi:outer membrane protein assembly factor BamB